MAKLRRGGFRGFLIMSIEKAIIKTIEGKEINVAAQTPIPCFRCGVCCTCYQPPLTSQDIDNIASALGISRPKCISKYTVKVPTKEGYLLKRTKKGCVFLAWDADGKARCTIHASRPQACREWTPSLSKPECLEGLAKLKSRGQIMLLEKLFSSPEEKQALYSSLKGEPPDA
ncbi:MAG: YkgJ family cysteine cluster protein [Chloroflexi bacterium]|nr:YkgJ family cysteine cluster protein [Chloroflexota bacterium]